MSEIFEISIHERPFVFIGAALVGFIALAAVYVNLDPTLSNVPQARASLTAHTLAFYLGSLSSVDGGVVEKNMNEDYVLQVGKYSKTSMFLATKPVSNYYLKALLYDDSGKLLAESEEVSFIGSIAVACENPGPCMSTDMITFVRLLKEPGGPVRIEGLRLPKTPRTVSGSSGSGPPGSGIPSCARPLTADELRGYVERYSSRFGVEKAFVLAMMAAESTMEQCRDGGEVKISEAGAVGLMQMRPSTADGLEGRLGMQVNLENAEHNVMAGTLYISDMLKLYQGQDTQKELAAATYNCNGIGRAVEKYCGGGTGCWEKLKPFLGKGKEFCQREIFDKTTGKSIIETVAHTERVMRLYSCFDQCLKSDGMCYSLDPCRRYW